MTTHEIKGYCPGALRPMLSGDGLVVRVRPFEGRLTSEQAIGIADLAARHGNGTLELSNRANLQIRGVQEANLGALIDGLGTLGVLDRTPEAESRRNILVSPFWQPGDETQRIAAALRKALVLAEDLALPSKFGFVVDLGTEPLLQAAPGDIRLERDSAGHMILVPEGSAFGQRVSTATAVAAALALAHWFAAHRGAHRRMAAVLAAGIINPLLSTSERARPGTPPQVGLRSEGALVAAAFGQLSATSLRLLAQIGDLRLTPWRMLMLEGATDLPEIEDVITNAADPLLRVVACAGDAGCAQAQGATRPVARALAAQVAVGETLHVSGCTKGCAHPTPATLTLTATDSGYDLVRDGAAGDTPSKRGLSQADARKLL